MSEQSPRYIQDVAHGPSASALVRPVVDRGVDMIYLADELLAPDFNDTLVMRGFNLIETEQTTDSITLKHAALSTSMTHRSLLGKSYAFLDLSVAYSVDAFGKEADNFSLVLHNNFNGSLAEIIGVRGDENELDITVQQSERAEDIAKKVPQVIDESALQVLLKDFLLQTDYDPRHLRGEYTTTALLRLLTRRSAKTQKTCEFDYRDGDVNDNDGSGIGDYSLKFTQSIKTLAKEGLRPTDRHVELSIESRQRLGLAALSHNSPLSILKLSFKASTTGNAANPGIKATISAGIGNVNPRHYSTAARQQLLEGTFRKYGNPAVFKETVLGSINRLASIQTSDIDLL